MDPEKLQKEDLEKRQTILLDIDYNKLLSYLAGVLVFFFLLFQITTEARTLPWLIVLIMSIASFAGVVGFLFASYHNYKEIIDLENKIGLSAIMEPSRLFSQRKNKDTTERKISIYLKFILAILLLLSFILMLTNLMLARLLQCSISIPG